MFGSPARLHSTGSRSGNWETTEALPDLEEAIVVVAVMGTEEAPTPALVEPTLTFSSNTALLPTNYALAMVISHTQRLTTEILMSDPELGAYTENPVKVAAVQSIGGCCCVLCGLLAFLVCVSYIPVSGVTEVPSYARTLLYMSLAHHMTDVQDAVSSISPPPPSFR